MTTAQEIKTMKKEISAMKSMLADHAEDVASEGQSKAMITRAEILDMANKAGESVRGFVSDKRDQAEVVAKTTQKKIKARPLTSAAIALAGGVVLGALLRR